MKIIFILLIILFCPSYSFSNESNFEDFLKTSSKCSEYFPIFEKKYSLPGQLLESISLAESGRWEKKTKKLVPWPWTVNQGGKSYFFNSKIEAVKEVEKMINKGVTNIDIGCMQVNLGYHSMSFDSLIHAFEPNVNVEYGAELLKNHYIRFSNWKKAIASYHSASTLGLEYYKRVKKIWNKDTTSNKKIKKSKLKTFSKNHEKIRSNMFVE